MDFAYTPRLLELKHRAVELARAHPALRGGRASWRAGWRTRTTPRIRAGGSGRPGCRPSTCRRSGAARAWACSSRSSSRRSSASSPALLWDCVWRPAQRPARLHARAQRERYLLPGIRGERRDAVAITEAYAGSDPQATRTTATPDRRRLPHRRREVVVTVRRRRRLPARPGASACLRAPRRCSWSTRICPGVRMVRDSPLHAHVRLRAPGVRSSTVVARGASTRRARRGRRRATRLTRDWFTEERLMIGARTIGAADRALVARRSSGPATA